MKVQACAHNAYSPQPLNDGHRLSLKRNLNLDLKRNVNLDLKGNLNLDVKRNMNLDVKRNMKSGSKDIKAVQCACDVHVMVADFPAVFFHISFGICHGTIGGRF